MLCIKHSNFEFPYKNMIIKFSPSLTVCLWVWPIRHVFWKNVFISCIFNRYIPSFFFPKLLRYEYICEGIVCGIFFFNIKKFSCHVLNVSCDLASFNRPKPLEPLNHGDSFPNTETSIYRWWIEHTLKCYEAVLVAPNKNVFFFFTLRG